MCASASSEEASICRSRRPVLALYIAWPKKAGIRPNSVRGRKYGVCEGEAGHHTLRPHTRPALRLVLSTACRDLVPEQPGKREEQYIPAPRGTRPILLDKSN